MAKGKPLSGVYACTRCDNIEAIEREVTCWKCGKGEMAWYPARAVVLALRGDNRLSRDIAWNGDLPWE